MPAMPAGRRTSKEVKSPPSSTSLALKSPSSASTRARKTTSTTSLLKKSNAKKPSDSPKLDLRCAECGVLFPEFSGVYVTAEFDWLKHCWRLLCRGCFDKTSPPVEKKPKVNKGREKFAKLMRSAMRKKRANPRKVPYRQSGKPA